MKKIEWILIVCFLLLILLFLDVAGITSMIDLFTNRHKGVGYIVIYMLIFAAISFCIYVVLLKEMYDTTEKDIKERYKRTEKENL